MTPLSATPLPVTVLTGLDRSAVTSFADATLLRGDRLASIWIDPAPARAGYVTVRTADSDGRLAEWPAPLEHDCLSCTMREVLVAALRSFAASGRYDSAIVALHPCVEPSAAVRAILDPIGGFAAIDTVAAVLDPARWLGELSGGATLADRGVGAHDSDERLIAAVLVDQLELADHLVFLRPWGSPAPVPAAEEHGLLWTLNPHATSQDAASVLDVDLTQVLRTGRFRSSQLDPFARA